MRSGWSLAPLRVRGGYTVYADPDTIRRKGDLVKMWILFDFKTVQRMAEHIAFYLAERASTIRLRGRALS